jgi:DNA-directed RNA polymerase subunit RPC12/RpoP
MKQVLKRLDQSLINAAASICAKEDIDFESLDARAQRGLIYYWCSHCSKIYPLNDLLVTRRKNICSHCKERVRIYSNSNKYGKLRRSILYKLLDLDEPERIPSTQK